MAQLIEKRFSDGKTYDIIPWTTRQTYRYLPKLAKLFAPISALLVEAYQGGEKMQEVLPGCIVYLSDELDNDGFDSLFKIIFDGVMVSGGSSNVDLDDVGVDVALEIAVFVIKERLSPFVKGGLLTNLLQQGIKAANLNEQLNSKTPKSQKSSENQE